MLDLKGLHDRNRKAASRDASVKGRPLVIWPEDVGSTTALACLPFYVEPEPGWKKTSRDYFCGEPTPSKDWLLTLKEMAMLLEPGKAYAIQSGRGETITISKYTRI